MQEMDPSECPSKFSLHQIIILMEIKVYVPAKNKSKLWERIYLDIRKSSLKINDNIYLQNYVYMQTKEGLKEKVEEILHTYLN